MSDCHHRNTSCSECREELSELGQELMQIKRKVDTLHEDKCRLMGAIAKWESALAASTDRVSHLKEAIRSSLRLVASQAEDEGLWSVPAEGTQRIAEAQLQHALRKLHYSVEQNAYSIEVSVLEPKTDIPAPIGRSAQACPVCRGRGLMPAMFYLSQTGSGVAASTGEVMCRTCQARGVVYVSTQATYSEAPNGTAGVTPVYVSRSCSCTSGTCGWCVAVKTSNEDDK